MMHVLNTGEDVQWLLDITQQNSFNPEFSDIYSMYIFFHALSVLGPKEMEGEEEVERKERGGEEEGGEGKGGECRG